MRKTKEKFSNNERKGLRIIRNWFLRKGRNPSIRELTKEMSFGSTRSSSLLINKLIEKKVLYRKKDGTLRIINDPEKDKFSAKIIDVPLVGTVSCGAPVFAEENIEAHFPVSTALARPGFKYFLIRAQGDSMNEADIQDEDIVLVKQQSVAENGQKVVALIDDEVTIKIIRLTTEAIILEPRSTNKEHKPIILSRDFQIQGVVIATVPFMKNIKTKKQDKKVNESKNQKPYFTGNNISIYKDDILKISSIPKSSVDLIITSPPYNVDIHYNSHADNLSYKDYLDFTRKWLERCYDLAKNEGRFCLNIPLDKNKGGQKSVGADITEIAKSVGWKYHSTIIWNEGNISRRTAWGSYMSASAPYVIAPVELILVLYKDSWKKTGGSRKNDIIKQEFMDWTNGVWTFPGQSKKGAGGHPAPFPVELPRRCIKLFSFIDDTVLDPFLGSGSTLVASYLYKRKGIGVDIDKDYCDIAIKRLQQEAKMNQSSLLE